MVDSADTAGNATAGLILFPAGGRSGGLPAHGCGQKSHEAYEGSMHPIKRDN